MRKVLLILDHAVESAGGMFMFLVLFIGENKVSYSLYYQRILFSLGTFLYGIPIPIAYLLNESRVRDVIVNKGWVEGFKAIFYSADKIKSLERQKVMNSSSAKNDGFNGVLQHFRTEATLREHQGSRVTTALIHNNAVSQND